MLNDLKNTTDFWKIIEEMVNNHEIVIDRPKGTPHPKHPNWIYEANYGYLKDTTSSDGAGIDVWVGSNDNKTINGIICIVDSAQNDSEIKILIGCTNDEIEAIYERHNKYDSMKGIFIPKN